MIFTSAQFKNNLLVFINSRYAIFLTALLSGSIFFILFISVGNYIILQNTVSHTHQLLSQMEKSNQDQTQVTQDKISQAKRNLQDKEPFSKEGFMKLYGIDSAGLEKNIHQYEKEYYLNSPNIITVAEYVKWRKEMDSYDAN
ncbi:hypothetical protein HYW42_03345 [Candidatus Daviesbacteria bacterium]|nr:hypothetical protein [Candidatus Daviesbacteria bacterium]